MNKWRYSSCKLTFYTYRNLRFCPFCGKELMWHEAVTERPYNDFKTTIKAESFAIYLRYEKWINLDSKEKE